jgi:2-polyprenyl-3-methyl-5-hydroxy-6-metoxy-1,4-benzoquinol methylase
MHNRVQGQCPVCRSAKASIIGVDHRLRLLECRDCSLVYSYPQPIELVRRRYLEQYDLAAYFDPWIKRKKVLFERRLDRLPSPRPGADWICDVGCADGQFLALARPRGWRIHGIEMNPAAARRARERGALVHEGVFEELADVPWGSFDVVTCWDALEHTATPVSFAERLTRLMKPGGTLMLTTVNRGALAWYLFRMRWSMVVEDHFTYWTRRAVDRLFEPFGLHVVHWEQYGLGRDFVSAIDVTWQYRRQARSKEPAERGRSGRWDTHRHVLFLEDMANRFFNRCGGGVGLMASLQKR